jgi:cytochrome oxidase Cu insertion factor (SCO1/SenC/PrrC family)
MIRRRALVTLSVSILVLAGCAGPVSPGTIINDDLGPVGDFALTERTGRTIHRDDLLGKVWVGAFVFTRCAGPCHQVSGTMARLQHDLADLPDVRLVTFTVDPEYDTRRVLNEYAERRNADPERWLFLTGEPDKVYSLIRNGFHLYAEPNRGAERTAGNEVTHDVRLALVDRRGHLRVGKTSTGSEGYFDGTRAEDIPLLEEKVRALLQEKS